MILLLFSTESSLISLHLHLRVPVTLSPPKSLYVTEIDSLSVFVPHAIKTETIKVFISWPEDHFFRRGTPPKGKMSPNSWDDILVSESSTVASFTIGPFHKNPNSYRFPFEIIPYLSRNGFIWNTRAIRPLWREILAALESHKNEYSTISPHIKIEVMRHLKEDVAF